MKILTINAGSSSLKFSVFELPEKKELINGYIERIGVGGSFYTLKFNGQKVEKKQELQTHLEAIEVVKRELIENNIISSLEEIGGVGHRVVHGGSYYSKSAIIDKELLDNVEKCNDLAPLHNPANLVGIRALQEALPSVKNVAVFDTAFHQTMDATQYIYPVPYEWYENYGVRKYGFHGTSHRFIDKSLSEYLNRDDLKIISCHIGSGGSLCAIDSHKSIDTTMGFTPLAGIMMGTRCGDIDPSIISFIMEKENKTVAEVMDILNKKSGYEGLSTVGPDNRDVLKAINEGNERAGLSFDIYNQRIANYMAQYNNLLSGSDAIVFTAGLGERSKETRQGIIERLVSLGIKLNEKVNDETFASFALISSEDSKIPVYVIPTNEELMIALDTYELIV